MRPRPVFPLQLAAIALFLVGTHAFAQSDDIKELQATVRAMQKTIAQQNARIATLEKQEQQLQKPPAPAQAQEVQQPAKSSALDVPFAAMSGGQSSAAHTSKISPPTPTQAAPTMTSPPPPAGFIAIPGTDTVVKLGGNVRLDAIADQRNNGNPNEFVTSTIPVPGQPGANSGSHSTMTLKGSRITLELDRPVPYDDTLKIYNEVDFYNDSSSTSMSLRVRHFYAQAWGLLVGQTFSTFMDIDVYPDVIDYEGPNGIMYKRQPQIRYTLPVYKGPDKEKVSLFASIEQPTSEVSSGTAALSLGASAVNRMPDAVIGSRWDGKFGHVQGTAVFRDLSFETPNGSSMSTLGWGTSLSGALNLSKRDLVMGQVTYGKGISHYVNDLGGENLDAAYDGRNFEAIPVFATTAAYTHQWNDQWSSTISGGYVRLDAPAALGPLTLDNTVYATVNLLWRPTPAVRVGLEYLYGRKEVLNGAERDAQRLNFVIRYDFVH